MKSKTIVLSLIPKGWKVSQLDDKSFKMSQILLNLPSKFENALNWKSDQAFFLCLFCRLIEIVNFTIGSRFTEFTPVLDWQNVL